MSLQPNEVLIIALVALIVLGPKRLPGAIRSIGRAFAQVREFTTTVRQQVDATLQPPTVEPGPTPATDAPEHAPTASELPASAADQPAEAAADRSAGHGAA